MNNRNIVEALHLLAFNIAAVIYNNFYEKQQSQTCLYSR